MKIVTYNVNGIKARLPRLLEYLAEQKPDVVCLQELKSADEGFPEEDIRDAGYGAVWHGQKGFNGVAILARGTDPVERKRGLAGVGGHVMQRNGRPGMGGGRGLFLFRGAVSAVQAALEWVRADWSR
ncbi:MAG: endonuclease/exonuclease/phosphatase family protein [Rhizobium sp.]|nr:endonuclease/exonuclease/phosphatase family protein [Rhizobium sp.]